jgi:hypothetical protein
MRSFFAGSFLLLAISITPAVAVADTKPSPAPAATTKNPDVTQMHADDCARARAQHRTCVLDIVGDDVEGSSPTAGGSAISIVDWPKGSSLIHLRRDFISEILKSAQDL